MTMISFSFKINSRIKIFAFLVFFVSEFQGDYYLAESDSWSSNAHASCLSNYDVTRLQFTPSYGALKKSVLNSGFKQKS